MLIVGIISMLVLLILVLFFWASKKNKGESLMQTPFECGFTSHFYSRHSFSVHYFMISLIFLFLDLEICLLFPFMSENFMNMKLMSMFILFVVLLLSGLLKEWGEKKLEWKF